MSSDKNNKDEEIQRAIEASDEEEIEIEGLEKKKQKKKRPKYLDNPYKARSCFIGVVLAFLFSTLFSFIFNINKVVEKADFVKNLSELFIMDRCIANIFTFFFMGLFIFIPIAFILALKWKKKAWGSIIVLGISLLFLQYKMLPYLQRLLSGKKIYQESKQVPPFVKGKWDHIYFSKPLKLVDTELKVSILVFKNKIIGINNADGKKNWSVEIPEKSSKSISESIYISGSNFYYSTKNFIFSRKIINGSIDWSYRLKNNFISNFSIDKNVISFYCKKCTIPGEKPKDSGKNDFFAYILFLNSRDGKLISILPVLEKKKERSQKPPVTYYLEPHLFIVFEKEARLVVADINKVLYDGAFSSFFDAPDIREALGLREKKREKYSESDQKVYFFKDKILFNSSKWLRVFDLKTKKQDWELNKGFLSNERVSDNNLYFRQYLSLLILSERGNVYAVSFKDGKLIWGPKSGGYRGKPAIIGKTLFISSSENNGTIYAMTASRGIYLYKWSQHKKIQDFLSWNNFLIFRGNDNLGITRTFGFEYK